MPVGSHPSFAHPANLTVPLWRYMDFTKFMAMLESKALYFARADLLGDPFEGSVPKRTARLVSGRADLDALWAENMSGLRQRLRQLVYVNCWHANTSESAAMWKLYAQTNEAIAIKTNFQALSQFLPDEVLVGEVQYLDFESGLLPSTNNMLDPFVHKRLSFEHERELRAVIPRLHLLAEPGIETPAGIQQHVELHMLIHAVYVAPSAAPWFRDLVTAMCTRYGLSVAVQQSSLDAAPFY